MAFSPAASASVNGGIPSGRPIVSQSRQEADPDRRDTLTEVAVAYVRVGVELVCEVRVRYWVVDVAAARVSARAAAPLVSISAGTNRRYEPASVAPTPGAASV